MEESANAWDRIRRDVIAAIGMSPVFRQTYKTGNPNFADITLDDPYTLEQLIAPRINISIVRPLTDQIYNLHDISVSMCAQLCRYMGIRSTTDS